MASSIKYLIWKGVPITEIKYLTDEIIIEIFSEKRFSGSGAEGEM